MTDASAEQMETSHGYTRNYSGCPFAWKPACCQKYMYQLVPPFSKYTCLISPFNTTFRYAVAFQIAQGSYSKNDTCMAPGVSASTAFVEDTNTKVCLLGKR